MDPQIPLPSLLGSNHLKSIAVYGEFLIPNRPLTPFVTNSQRCNQVPSLAYILCPPQFTKHYNPMSEFLRNP